MQDKKVGMGRDGWDDMGGLDWIGREVLEGRDGKGGGKEGMGREEWNGFMIIREGWNGKVGIR